MELEQEIRELLATLDDDALRKTLASIAQKMGVNPSLAALYFSDLDKIRKAAANLNEEDLQKVRESLGDEKMNALAQEIRKEAGKE